MQVFAKVGTAFLYSLLVSSVLVGCSSSNKNNTPPQTMLVHVQAGQGGVADAYIRSAIIQNNGLIAQESDGRVTATKILTNPFGVTSLRVMRTQMHSFQLVNRELQEDRKQTASTMRCQWVAGCNGASFGQVTAPKLNWRATTFGLSENETIAITPLTELATHVAKELVYTTEWQTMDSYSPQSLLQANSQVSRLFGLENALYQGPADLSLINSINIAEPTLAKDAIRYAAIVAAWMHLEEQDSEFTQKAAVELVSNQAQIYESKEDAVLALDRLYQLASENLQSIQAVGAVKALVDEVLQGFSAEMLGFEAGRKTEVWPELLEILIGSESADYSTGLALAKAFVTEVNNTAAQFYDPEYKETLQGYYNNLKGLSDANKSSYEALLEQLVLDEKEYRSQCTNGSSECSFTSEQGLTYQLTNSSLDNNYLKLHVLGQAKQGNLTFDVKDLKDSNGSVTDSGYVIVYFGVSNTLQSLLASSEWESAQPLAYEVHLADFTIYDHVANRAEQTGQLDIFYRGVADSDGSNYRFNIEKIILNSKISDHINDSGKQDQDVASLYIGAQSTNAHTYYPKDDFAKLSLEEFFKPAADAPEVDSVEQDLIGYKFGTETLSNQQVEYLDIYIKGGNSNRYRFYPDIKRTDTLDANGNGDITEIITTHDMAICPLKESNGQWQISGTCSPKQRFYEKRDIQKTIANLWRTGVFSYLSLPSQGDYFVEWPATKENGCFQLDTLDRTNEVKLNGKLISQAVLGLDNLRLTSEILLKDQPKTLLDVKVYRPTEDRVRLTYGLSTNYTGLNSDEVVVGASGNKMSRIIVNYNTDSAFSRTGNIALYKGGVSLQASGVSSETKEGELFFGLSQTYDNLPHQLIIGPDGDETVCITANEPVQRTVADKPKFSLAFGGVVYGFIEYVGSEWKATFVDGSSTSMANFDKYFEIVEDFKLEKLGDLLL